LTFVNEISLLKSACSHLASKRCIADPTILPGKEKRNKDKTEEKKENKIEYNG
jgi:hypothetical protein